MARTAEARLSVTVEDSALDNHVAKLNAVKQGWDGLKQGAAALQNLVPDDLVKSLTTLNSALTSASSGGAGAFAKEMTALGKAIERLPRNLNTLATALSNVHAALSAINASQATNSFRALGDVLSTHFQPEVLRAQASSMGALASNTARVGRASEAATRSVSALAVAFDKVKNAETPLIGMTEAVEANTAKSTSALKDQGSTLKTVQQGFIRAAASLFIMYHWSKSFFEILQRAGTEIDLENTLTLSIENFNTQMERATEATQGTVTRLEMMKSAALMSSFGLPMENFAGQMEMVQKMAIRTGQSTEYLMESLARGVSRLSPMILDNLGIQVSLSAAYETYAASLGKSASALTKMEQKTAVMNEVMRQSAELTKEVDPSASLAAQNEAALTRIKNLVSDAGQAILRGFVFMFQDANEAASEMLLTLKLVKKEMEESGDSTFQMTALKFVALTDPGRMSGYEKFWRGAMDVASDILGIEKEMVELNKQDIQDLETKLKLEKEKAAVSAKLYQEAVDFGGAGRLEFRTHADDVRLEQSAERYNRLLEEAVGLMDVYNAMKENGFAVDEKTYALRKKALENEIDFLEYTVNPKIIADRMDAVLGGAAKNRRSLKDTLGGLHQEEGVDSLEKNLQISVMQQAMDEAMAKQKRDIEDSVLGIAAGTLKTNDFAIDGLAIAEKATDLAHTQYQEYIKTHGAELKALKDQEAQIIKNQYEAQGMLAIQYQHQVAEKDLNAALEDYNKKLANSITLKAGDVSATQEEVKAAGDKVAKLQGEVGLLKEKAKLQEIGLKAAHDVTSLDKKARAHQAYILAGYKTRAEVQATFLKVQKVVVDAELAVAAAINAQNLLRVAGMSFLVSVAEGKIDEGKKKIAEAAEELGKLKIDIDRFPKDMAGWGGGKDAEDKSGEFVLGSANAILKQETFLNEAGRQSARFIFQGFSQETTTKFDKEGNFLSEEVKVLLDEMMDESYDYLTVRSDSNSLLTPMFKYRPREVREELERALEDIKKFQQKLLDAGALTAQDDERLRKLQEMLRIEREINKERVKELENIQTQLKAVEDGFKNAFTASGLDQFWGDDINNMLGSVTESLGLMDDALNKQEVSMYDMVTAAMPAIRGLTAAFTKDLKVRAGMEAAMNAAAAWAAVPVWPTVATHAIAAGMYAGIAGGAIKLPTKTTSSANKKEDKGSNKGPLHIHLYGDAMATDGERSRYLEQIMAEARAEGRV